MKKRVIYRKVEKNLKIVARLNIFIKIVNQRAICIKNRYKSINNSYSFLVLLKESSVYWIVG